MNTPTGGEQVEFFFLMIGSSVLLTIGGLIAMTVQLVSGRNCSDYVLGSILSALPTVFVVMKVFSQFPH
jgi:hypothetical protein